MCSNNASTEGFDQRATDIPSVEPVRFLGAMSYLASGCSIVASSDGADRSGFTATEVCSVTADPPRLLVCVDREIRAYAVIVESGTLSVNVLSESQVGMARRFAGMGRDMCAEDCFQEGEWVTGRLGAPVLRGALASLDCRVVEVVPASSHTIFICEVIDVVAERPLGPLIVFNGAYATLVGR